MTPPWTKEAIFYHIYPLGLCGAPPDNQFNDPVIDQINDLRPWVDHLQSLGCNALYLGPIFQSSSHGYDTVDYYQIDRRLGDLDSMADFAAYVHQRGIKLILDGVFNHVGRDFWAFQDVLKHGERSEYRTWFHNLRFGEQSALGDPFQYEGWHGHQSLVKLNLFNPDVCAHLFDAVRMWIDRFEIEGLRLDAADCIDFEFLKALRDFTRTYRNNFWLMGEVVHGDYRKWVNPQSLDSVTNYEAYKGLYSSLQEANYFEIAHSLKRQFGKEGIYRDLQLYNFVDNHDVNRVASQLDRPTQLFPLYLLLFTMPGIPSIYYGSEWGIKGEKSDWSDTALRPALQLTSMVEETAPLRNLIPYIRQLATIRHASDGLRYGNYAEVLVDHQQFVFQRQHADETLVVALNSAAEKVSIEIPLPWAEGTLVDLLDPSFSCALKPGKTEVDLPATGGRILKRREDSL